MIRIHVLVRRGILWLLCFSLASNDWSPILPVPQPVHAYLPAQAMDVQRTEVAEEVNAKPSLPTQVFTETTSSINLPLSTLEPAPWLQSPRSLENTNAAIQITESGLNPTEVEFFGPGDVTWINTTTATQTVHSGTAPPIGSTVYMPLVRKSTGESALQRARSILQQTAIDDFAIVLGPGEISTRRFSEPGLYTFHLVGTAHEGQIHLSGTTLVTSSPVDGSAAVAPTRETILTFSGPLEPTSVTADAFTIRFGNRSLPFRPVLSTDRKRITLFYENPLPGNARIQIMIDGNKLNDAQNLAVDVDLNNVAGGVRTISFDTLSLTVSPGTSACGRVFASELSTSISGASVNTPLQGATITVDGMESVLRTTTDANGNFCLDPSPAGLFFVHVDGRTASNGVPAGAYYPYVGKPWQTVLGQRNEVGDVFLPLVPPGTLQTVSQSEDTHITFIEDILEQHPNFAGVSILVPADSLYADDGTRGGSVGIAPVPPDRLPGELPDGLEFPVVITVQTDGPTNFAAPVPVCFPNLPDPVSGTLLPPGAKDYLFSFNHDSGAWEAVGSMTVTVDGTLVCSDPGVGIEAPGWHGSGPQPATPPPADGADPLRCDPDRLSRCVVDEALIFLGCDAACTSAAIGAIVACGAASAGILLAACLIGALALQNVCLGACYGTFDKAVLECEDDWGNCASGTRGSPVLPANWLVLSSDGDPTVEAIREHIDQAIALLRPYVLAGDEIPQAVLDEVNTLVAQANAVAGGDAETYLRNYRLAIEEESAVIDAELGEADGNAPSYGVRYLAEIMRPNGALRLRGTTEAYGQYRLFLPRDGRLLTVSFYDPQTHSYGIVQPNLRPNAPYRLPRFYLSPLDSTFSDFDEDGLADVVEVIYGTETGEPDSDGDGVNDGVEVQRGTNPLDGTASTNGVIASVDTPGAAVDVCAEGALAVVADSTAGVSILNVFSGMNPIIIAQVDTPGIAQAVACAAERIAVADGSAGLAIIDVRSPSNAQIERQIPLDGSTQTVVVAGPFAFVGTSAGRLAVVELATGTIRVQHDLGEAVHDLAVEGERLYVLTESALIVYSQIEGQLSELGRTAVVGSPSPLESGRKLFVGSGLAYVGYFNGYSSFDVSGLSPQLIGTPPIVQLAIHDLKTNGSGLLLGITSFLGEGTLALSLYDISDPTDVSLFLTSFETPGHPRALTIHNGLAYVADSDAGLQVINYHSADVAHRAPSLHLESNFTPGIAEAAAPMRLTAVVTDDVQVSNVTFYVDQVAVAVDGNFPFEHRFTTPQLAQGNFRLRARALDTGGNEAWTNELTILFADDATPPRLVSTQPQDNSALAPNTLQTISIAFDEALQSTTINSTTLQLFNAGADWLLDTADDQSIQGAVAYDASNRTVTLTLPTTLGEGRYRIVLASTLTDLAGNPLVGSAYAWSFNVGVVVWDGGGNGISWHDPLNWGQDEIPPQNALVIIDDTGNQPILYNQGTTLLSTLHSNRPIQIVDGTIGIQGEGLLRELSMNGGTLTGSGTVTVTGVLTWTSGQMTGAGKTVLLGDLILNGRNMYLTTRTFDNWGTALWTRANSASDFYLASGAIFNNRPGATFHISSDLLAARVFGGDNSAYRFDNGGSFVKSNSSDLAISVPFNNAGTVEIQAGVVDLGGGTSTGSFNLSPGSGLRVSQTFAHTFDSNASFSGEGTVEVSAGTTYFTGNHTLSNLHLNGGSLVGSGVMTITNILTLTKGTMVGPGRTVSLGNLVLNGGQVILDGRIVDNGGDAIWIPSSNATNLYLDNGAFFNNLSGASLQISDTLSFAQIYGDFSTNGFTNDGSLVKNNSSAFHISIPFSNTGSVNVQSGLFQIYDGDNSGTMSIATDMTLDIDGVFVNQASGVINGNGVLDLQNATFTNHGLIAPTVIVID